MCGTGFCCSFDWKLGLGKIRRKKFIFIWFFFSSFFFIKWRKKFYTRHNRTNTSIQQKLYKKNKNNGKCMFENCTVVLLLWDIICVCMCEWVCVCDCMYTILWLVLNVVPRWKYFYFVFHWNTQFVKEWNQNIVK